MLNRLILALVACGFLLMGAAAFADEELHYDDGGLRWWRAYDPW
jgi:hypothetical protein